LLNEDTEHRFNNFQTRMNYTWKKATKAISTTSATTAMAFLATGLSKVMPISAFGFFSAILVVTNYLFAVITFPALLLFWERYIAHRCRYRKYIGNLCLKIKTKICKKSNNDQEQDDTEKKESNNNQQDSRRIEEEDRVNRRSSAKVSNASDQEAGAPKNQEEDKAEKKLLSEERFIEKFFRIYWNRWVYKVRWIVLICIAIFVALCVWRVTEFEPSTEANQILPDGHYLTKLRNSLRNDFHTGENDDSIKVSIIWGIQKVDNSGISRWDAENKGKLVYDSDFDLSLSANQQRIEDICTSLESNSLVKSNGVT